jgi:Fe-Mn family superoxide dismutase
MGNTNLYSLPKLSFDYKDLAPFISEEQLRLHHEKHHAAYVTGANAVLERIDKEFGGFEQFKKEFTQAAVSTEGSGWAALSHCLLTNRPIIMQIEKHNVNVYPMFRILLVLDVLEHAYYLDYKNLLAKFV